MKELASTLIEEFKDKEYAEGYAQSYLEERIASQVYALRKSKGWTQTELAKRAGVAQPSISEIESGEFGSLTMRTLGKLAAAFDVAYTIRFESFAECILDFINFNPQATPQSRLESLDKLSREPLEEKNGKLVLQIEVKVSTHPVTKRPHAGLSDFEFQVNTNHQNIVHL